MAFGKKETRKKPTKGFSELNKRTYEASEEGQQSLAEASNRRRASSQSRQQYGNYGSQPNNYNHNSYTNRTPVGQQPQGAYASANGASSTRGGYGYQGRANGSAYGAPNAAQSLQDQQASAYSRSSLNSRYHDQVNAAKKKKKRRIIIIVIAAVVAALIGAGVAFASNFWKMNEGMDDIGLTPTQYANQPFYMVLMGVDSSEERKADGGTDDNYRSDSIILARIDPVEKIVSLVSLHRDVEVDMGEYGTQKLNAAHSLGGPELVVKTVSNLAGVPINHYAEINFDGFKAAVDSLGGVEVEVPMTIDDELAGGYVPAGLQTLNGEQALVLARARHAYDDYGDGDKFRAANQRLVLSAIAKKVLSSDIVTIANTAKNLAQYIKTDMNINDIIGLAQLMKDIDPNKQVYSAMMPTEGVYKNGVWYEELDEEEWKAMMKRMDEGKPPSTKTYIDPNTGTVLSYAGDSSGSSSTGEANYSGTVAVRNGTNIDGKAATASTKLSNLGFTTDVGNANSSDYTTTVIVYTNDSQKATAEAIRDAIGCGQVVQNNNEYAYTTDYLVVIGTDYNA